MNENERKQLLADVEAFCQEIRDVEELCYVEHKFNDQVIPLAKKHNILGMPVPKEYGGRGSDTVTYARALARINQEGTGVRTFFSGHTSIGEYPILTWGNYKIIKRGPMLGAISGYHNWGGGKHPTWDMTTHGGPKGKTFYDTWMELIPEAIVFSAEPLAAADTAQGLVSFLAKPKDVDALLSSAHATLGCSSLRAGETAE